jgi:hypothetical protein
LGWLVGDIDVSIDVSPLMHLPISCLMLVICLFDFIFVLWFPGCLAACLFALDLVFAMEKTSPSSSR